VPEEVLIDQFRYFQLAVGIVGDAVLRHVANLVLLEL